MPRVRRYLVPVFYLLVNFFWIVSINAGMLKRFFFRIHRLYPGSGFVFCTTIQVTRSLTAMRLQAFTCAKINHLLIVCLFTILTQ